MVITGDGRAITADGSGGAGDSRSPLRLEINEEPPNVSTGNVLEKEILSHSRARTRSVIGKQTIEKLPYELLSNIFIRLLAKQVAQMRSVSRSWNDLLSQPWFVKSHLVRSIQTNDQILLVFYFYKSKQFTAHPCGSPHLELTNLIKLPFNPLPEYTPIRIIGALNGLICSSYGYENPVIHIWNPSLSAQLTLPSYAIPSKFHHMIFPPNPIEFHFRFGFDPKTDDYKVVKITSVTKPGGYIVKWWLQVEMYSMREDYWELITERFPSHITSIYGNDDVVCRDGHDGHLHWLAEKLDSERIVSFDLGSKTFREIPLPGNTKDRINTLGVLGKKLCVMSRGQSDSQIEVWVMDEVETWVKRYVFLQFIDLAIPFGFTSNNKLLLTEDCDLRFLMYDPVADKAKHFEKYCSDDDNCGAAFRIVEYVDSLVWVTPTRQHWNENRFKYYTIRN